MQIYIALEVEIEPDDQRRGHCPCLLQWVTESTLEFQNL